MKVSDFQYRRVTAEKLKAPRGCDGPRVKAAKSVEDVLAARRMRGGLAGVRCAASALSYMPISMDPADGFLKEKGCYEDEAGPSAQNASLSYASALLDSLCGPSLKKRCRLFSSGAWRFSANRCRRR